MPWRPWRAGSLVRPHARHRPAAPVTIMAALGILTLAKLGLLAADMFDSRSAAGSPAAEQAPSTRASASISIADAEHPEPMPAAGPDPPAPGLAGHGSTRPEDQAPPAGAADHAAAPAENFDPSRISAGEVAVLEQLAARRAALDQRARELDQRQALLETAAATLDARIAELSGLRNQIAKSVDQHDAAEEAKIRSLVKIYEAMKAKAAAEIFNRLEMPVLIRVVERMHEPKSADVLARMDPVKAKQVTTELARRSKLLEAPVPGSSSASSPANGG
jgi:flagellar motility protein MotE (MotC chaperone)